VVSRDDRAKGKKIQKRKSMAKINRITNTRSKKKKKKKKKKESCYHKGLYS